MRVVKNTSLQGLSVCFNRPGGIEHIFISPRNSVTVPDTWGGPILDTLISRRMLKVSHAPNPVPPKEVPYSGSTKFKKKRE